MCYDMKYALRLCSEHDKQKACVHIYSTMGLFEEAVDLSLKVLNEVTSSYHIWLSAANLKV